MKLLETTIFKANWFNRDIPKSRLEILILIRQFIYKEPVTERWSNGILYIAKTLPDIFHGTSENNNACITTIDSRNNLDIGGICTCTNIFDNT